MINKPVKILLPERPNLSLIPKAVRQCLDNKINPEDIIIEKNIIDLNFAQFCFLMGVKSFRGNNFSKNLSLIKKYISFHKDNIDLTLQTENGLHFCFLKRYETDDAYDKFYNFFSKLYLKKGKDQNDSRKIIDSILFFVHTPTFLAHTNPMFKMLENRKNKSIKVAIACQGFSKQFFEKCKLLDIEFFNVYDDSINNSFKKVLKLTVKYKTVIWLSVPIYLSYFRTLYNDVSYWSHKFHPDISKLRSYIGTFNEDKHFVFKNKNKWKNFRNDFEIKNLSSQKANWSIRRNNFGTFCREELINQKHFWEIIKIILLSNKGYTYFYCGRNPIHNHWCSELSIPSDQVQFLGWLEKPHLKLKQMAFLIDGLNLGHGYLGVEAMAAEVPIIFPEKKKSYSNVENYLIRTQVILNKKNDKNYLNRYSLIYSKDNILNIVNSLISREDYNQFYGSHYKKAVEHHPNESFEDFVNLL